MQEINQMEEDILVEEITSKVISLIEEKNAPTKIDMYGIKDCNTAIDVAGFIRKDERKSKVYFILCIIAFVLQIAFGSITSGILEVDNLVLGIIDFVIYLIYVILIIIYVIHNEDTFFNDRRVRTLIFNSLLLIIPTIIQGVIFSVNSGYWIITIGFLLFQIIMHACICLFTKGGNKIGN